MFWPPSIPLLLFFQELEDECLLHMETLSFCYLQECSQNFCVQKAVGPKEGNRVTISKNIHTGKEEAQLMSGKLLVVFVRLNYRVDGY